MIILQESFLVGYSLPSSLLFFLYSTNLILSIKNQYFEILNDATSKLGIVFGTAIMTAESLGYGITPIGTIKNNLAEVIEILELLELVVTFVGICIVFKKKPGRDGTVIMGIEGFVHEEKYNKFLVEKEVKRYKEVNKDWVSYCKQVFSTKCVKELSSAFRKQKFID